MSKAQVRGRIRREIKNAMGLIRGSSTAELERRVTTAALSVMRSLSPEDFAMVENGDIVQTFT